MFLRLHSRSLSLFSLFRWNFYQTSSSSETDSGRTEFRRSNGLAASLLQISVRRMLMSLEKNGHCLEGSLVPKSEPVVDSSGDATKTGSALIMETSKFCNYSHTHEFYEVTDFGDYDLAYSSDNDVQSAGCSSPDIQVNASSESKGSSTLVFEGSSSLGIPFPSKLKLFESAADFLVNLPYSINFDEAERLPPAQPSSPVGNRADIQEKIKAELELASEKLFNIAVEMEVASTTKGKKLSDES